MDINLDNLINMPLGRKIGVTILIITAISAAIYSSVFQPAFSKYQVKSAALEVLKSEVVEREKQSRELPRHQREYAALKTELEQVLAELPNEKEIPSLLATITATGKGAGLEFQMFRPKQEIPNDFYAAVPIEISVSGAFRDVANFFARVAAMPRIVNIGNVNISEVKESGDKVTIKTNCVATTFRFVEKKESKNVPKK